MFETMQNKKIQMRAQKDKTPEFLVMHLYFINFVENYLEKVQITLLKFILGKYILIMKIH